MCYIAEDQDNMSIKNRVKKEEYQLVLITSEMLLDNKQWRKCCVMKSTLNVSVQWCLMNPTQ